MTEFHFITHLLNPHNFEKILSSISGMEGYYVRWWVVIPTFESPVDERKADYVRKYIDNMNHGLSFKVSYIDCVLKETGIKHAVKAISKISSRKNVFVNFLPCTTVFNADGINSGKKILDQINDYCHSDGSFHVIKVPIKKRGFSVPFETPIPPITRINQFFFKHISFINSDSIVDVYNHYRDSSAKFLVKELSPGIFSEGVYVIENFLLTS